MALHQLPEYDDQCDWKAYITKAEAYFEATGVSDSGKKRALLVAALSTRTVQVLAGQVAPRKPNSLTYEEAVKVLDDYFDPKRHEITESFRFFNRCQLEGEPIQQFIVEIRRIADGCNFGDMLDRMLRDRIVCGVRSNALQKQLLAKTELTLREAEAIAISAEAAEKDTKQMSADLVPLLKVHAGQAHADESVLECGRCGSKKHNRNACGWAKARCYRCRGYGHLAKMCQSDVRKGRLKARSQCRQGEAFAVTADVKREKVDDDDAHIWTLTAPSKGQLSPPIRRTFTWCGIDVPMIVDTGSPVSVVSRELFEKNREQWPPLTPACIKLSCYLGELPVLGKLSMPVFYNDKEVKSSLIVLNCSGPSLCGRDLIAKFSDAGSSVLNVSVQQGPGPGSSRTPTMDAVLSEFQDVFSTELGLIDGHPVHLKLKEGATPKFCKARSLPFAIRDKVSKEIDRLVKLGILSPVTYAEWATPIVPVMKKDGTVRICVDFKVTLNPVCELEQYPLPVIDDIFACLNGGDCFSTLDLRDAYNQVPLDEDTRKLCVINTHRGLFCYNRLPFGIASAPAIFQRKIDTVLQGLTGVQAYLDDVLVSEKHGSAGKLREVLQRFREHGVKLRLEKCSFRQEAVTYLGHKIDREGLHPIEKHVEAIAQAPNPQNVQQLRSFLGMITFYSKFVPNMSSLLAPLYKLLENNTRWFWGHAQETAFSDAKQCLREAAVLAHYDPEKPLKLECDASQDGIGAVLFHTFGKTNKPVGFRSRTLTRAEKNYSQLEREALALVFGVSKFRDYLIGREFVLVTDHQPLLGLLKADRPTPALAAARIQRWALYLGGFRYQLQYCPGKQLLNADALSRLPQRTSEPKLPEGDPPDYLLALAGFDEGTVSVEELRQLTADDPSLSQVMRFTKNGWPSCAKSLNTNIAPFFDKKLELSLAHGLLYWGRRVVVPTKARRRVLYLLHETHQGSSAMKAVARSSFWWPGLDHDIERVAASCQNCVQNLPMPATATPKSWPVTDEKWARVHIDFAGPISGNMILVIVDAYSKWIEAVPLRQANASCTINCLRAIFCRFGVPRTIVSDNGAQFTGDEFATFVRKNNITHLRTAVYHPQSNGLAERAVRTIKDGLKKIGEGRLDDKLNRLLFNYRRTPNHSGKSPSELLFGYQIRSRLDTCFPPVHAGPANEPDDWQLSSPEADVYARNFGTGEKWTPGIVQSKIGSRMVAIRTPAGSVRRHVDQVRKRENSPPPLGTDQEAGNQASRTGTPSDYPQSPRPSAEQGGIPEPDHEIQPELAASNAATDEPDSPPQALRRSTRQRKPVQRLQY
ncbi:uncharacterized protein K02A2.6-like [Dermacentor silvarum]|uniref:uncharacterized protein K02A2.6-like n=1 Tax=Dermacentor silvarum TaxID=543639 RepID=UPI0021019C84|nr:uncharacterized protein K02A2.6-like [Dermacentor silvarum]